jgi:hypothetical protein
MKLPVPGQRFSPQFLRMLGAPEHTQQLAFKVEAGGLLQCVATYYTDVRDETVVKEWVVRLEPSSAFYRLITGELQ